MNYIKSNHGYLCGFDPMTGEPLWDHNKELANCYSNAQVQRVMTNVFSNSHTAYRTLESIPIDQVAT